MGVTEGMKLNKKTFADICYDDMSEKMLLSPLSEIMSTFLAKFDRLTRLGDVTTAVSFRCASVGAVTLCGCYLIETHVR
jgi:hypothetical protein